MDVYKKKNNHYKKKKVKNLIKCIQKGVENNKIVKNIVSTHIQFTLSEQKLLNFYFYFFTNLFERPHYTTKYSIE